MLRFCLGLSEDVTASLQVTLPGSVVQVLDACTPTARHGVSLVPSGYGPGFPSASCKAVRHQEFFPAPAALGQWLPSGWSLGPMTHSTPSHSPSSILP
ncbi:hypothetical protein CEP51_013673 [Fusarium floridanum]|uniref:Uncharacterized protein n=1 Tax=Fusarium floridanum TaxID=1325733 RepID=A0A428Q783_9HYPO|nr:hypothetical protein CEP51_013673 [Fusarium floridanum]